jgi:soluble lytic murein transglycosylase-like protein
MKLRKQFLKGIFFLVSFFLIARFAFCQNWITDPFSQSLSQSPTIEASIEFSLGKGCPINQNPNYETYETNSDYQQYMTLSEKIRKCFEDAGSHYGINPLLLWAIAKVESNFNPYALNKNKNNSYDMGLMQINSAHLKTLEKHGLVDKRYIWDPCYNIYVGAWVLSQCIKKYGYTWTAIGCYNAQTPWKRKKYSYKVYKAIEPYLKPYSQKLK